jgi:hypothetical protein
LVGVSRGRLAEDDVLPASGVGGGFLEDEAGADLAVDGGVGSENFGGAGVLPGGRFMSGERKGFFRTELAERRRRLGGGRGVLGGGSAIVLVFESWWELRRRRASRHGYKDARSRDRVLSSEADAKPHVHLHSVR